MSFIRLMGDVVLDGSGESGVGAASFKRVCEGI
jgi:hypothetical protein